MDFEVEKLSPVLGAEIKGLDLSQPLDSETVAALREVWLSHLVLLFRGQDLSEAEQSQFAGYFSAPTPQRNRPPAGQEIDIHPNVMLITNLRDNGEPIGHLPDGELNFHSDSAFLEHPLMATVLYGIQIPSEGGNTRFANMYKVYDALDPTTRSHLEGRRAVNVYDFATMVKTGRADRAKAQFADHPAIRTHPETGGKVIYVNRLMTEEFVDMTEAESDALLAELFEFTERSEFYYEHVWRVGDLLMWDNRCTQHARTDFPATETRILKRVGIEGDRPY